MSTPRATHVMNPGTVGASPSVAVVTPEALAALVREAVGEALAEREATAAPALLDRRGLAQALGCSPDQVDRLRRDGCPELRLGDVPRFELAAVLAWLRRKAGQELHEPMPCEAGGAETGSGAGQLQKVSAREFQHGEAGRVIPSTCGGAS